MSLPVETEGGWTWWIASLKAAKPELVIDYKEMMKKYIAGVKWEDV